MVWTLLLTVCGGLQLALAAEGEKAWNYYGTYDQVNWGAVAAICASGQAQSPINFVGADTVYNSKLTAPKFDYQKNASDVIGVYNNGHKVGSKFHGDLYVTDANLGGTYKVYGAHFHWGLENYKGSEHLFNGRSFPLELHVVTYNNKYADLTAAVNSKDKTALAVFGTMYQVTDSVTDSYLDQYIKVFDQLKVKDDKKQVDIPAFNVGAMSAPDQNRYFRYQGSLTTPGCNEQVVWTSFVTPRRISKAQMAKFRTLSSKPAGQPFQTLGDNYRNPLPLNGRKVERSFEELRPVASCDDDVVIYDFNAAPGLRVTSSLLALLVAAVMLVL